jgi:selenide,water dikinase
VVLIGGGHAHVQVIKAFQSRPDNLNVTLIDLQSSASYSGMVPGCVAGLYNLDQVQIALDSLANWSGIEFVCGKVVGMSFKENGGRQSVLVEESDDDGNVVRREIPFDVVSVDIGSTTRDFTSIPGADRYTISTRPISDLVRRIQAEDDVIKEKIK